MMADNVEWTLQHTKLRLDVGEDWTIPARARLRRIAWLDQKGRIWNTLPLPSEPFDGGSFTPLLVPLDD